MEGWIDPNRKLVSLDSIRKISYINVTATQYQPQVKVETPRESFLFFKFLRADM